MARTPLKDLLWGAVGRGPFPHELSWLIDNPLRRFMLSPEEHARRLDLKPSDRVLEIGPGSGYFSRAVAERLPAGALVLLDLQPEMLAKAAAKLARAGHGNIETVAADATALPFADGRFDVVFLTGVLGEIPDRLACLRSCHHVLRDGGTLAITEEFPDPDFQPLARVRGEAETAGFAFVRRFGRPWNYTAVFRSVSAVAGD